MSWIFASNRDIFGGKFFVRENWRVNVRVLSVEIMHKGWVVSKEVFFDISWINILGIWLYLAVLSEKVANNNGESNPYN